MGKKVNLNLLLGTKEDIIRELQNYEIKVNKRHLNDIFKSNNKLLIGVNFNYGAQSLDLLLNDGNTKRVKFSKFTIPGTRTSPDFSKIAIIDYGQTLKLGSYQAPVDAIL